jgi:hypothetical protein
MKNIYLYAGIAFTLAACSSPAPTKNLSIDSVQTAPAAVASPVQPTGNSLTDTTKVKAWITKVIEDYANATDLNTGFENLRKAFTDDYYNYKQDALNLGYDNSDTSMTEEGFKKKWQHKYNTKYAGEGGYVISAQDNGKVKVSNLYLLKQIDNNTALYRVVIKDLDFKATFNREIKVIVQDDRYMIDDILEYD